MPSPSEIKKCIEEIQEAAKGHPPYLDLRSESEIVLNGTFTVEDLKKVVAVMETDKKVE